jgi:50S ribosomal protein L16 3-hydroxylase
VFFDDPGAPLSAAGFARQARRLGLRLHRKSTMLYTGSVLCINGERQALPRPPGRAPLLQLADHRHLPPAACVTALADTTIGELLHEWFDAGWIEFDNGESKTNVLA